MENFKDTWYKVFSGYSSISQHLEKFAQRPTNANTHKSSRDMKLRYRYGMSTERLERSALLILYPSNSRGPSDPLVNEPWANVLLFLGALVDEFVGAR